MPVINIMYHTRERPQFDPRALMIMGPQINIDVLPPTVVEKWAKSHNVEIIKVS